MKNDHLELLYLRRVLIGILQITIEDMHSEKNYVKQANQDDHLRNKAEALAFVRSSAFDLVCDAVGIPACRVRTLCLK